MATLIKVDGTRQEVQPARDGKFTMEQMQKLVGGYVERVKLGTTERMVVDEDAKMRGLSVNPAASLILQDHKIADVVAGDVLVGTKKEFGLG